MKKDILKEIIRDFHSRELPRLRERDVKVPLDTGKVMTLSGVRRSGKTSILFATMLRLISAGVPKDRLLYVNFEDERLDLKKQDLDLILQCYRELYPKNTPLSNCYFFFDEIQNVEGWEKFIRRLHDSVSRNIFITGSNSKLLSREIATSLRGRTLTEEILPLSFREYLYFHEAEVDIYDPQKRAAIINFFERYLLEGGFPETVFQREKQLRERILQEYLDVMLYRDLIERCNITNIPALKYFIRRMFDNITSPASINKIYNELKSQGYKVGKSLLYEFLDASESAWLFLILRKFSQSVLKRELGEKKAYGIDNGLLNAVTFSFSGDYGRLLENAVFLELHRQGKELFFFKERKECDFVVTDKSHKPMVMQACYSIAERKTRQRELGGLTEAGKRLNAGHGIVVTMSEEEQMEVGGMKIDVLPAYKFFLGQQEFGDN